MSPAPLRDTAETVGDEPLVVGFAANGARLAGVAHVGTNDSALDWSCAVDAPESELFATVRDFDRLLLIVGGIIVVALVLWALLASNAILRPVRWLAAATERVARGDLSARVPVRGRDELAQLGRAFNEMAADLDASQRRLRTAEREAAWAEMARQVAHEIKNPLTPMRVCAQMVQRAQRSSDPRLAELVERLAKTVVAQTEQLARIASDFRQFAGRPELRLEGVAADRLIDDVAEDFAGVLAAGEPQLVLTQAAPGVRIRADRSDLRRVFLNLIQNALAAVGTAGRIEVSSEPAPEGGALFRVKDDGPGVPADVVGRLFEPYFTTRSSGTGLGLAICRRIVEAHGVRSAWLPASRAEPSSCSRSRPRRTECARSDRKGRRPATSGRPLPLAMNSRTRLSLVLFGVALALTAFYLLSGGGGEPAPPGPVATGTAGGAADTRVGTAADKSAEAASDANEADRVVVDATPEGPPTVVRGIVLDARTLQPLPGVEVAAMKEPPSLERLMSRFRSAFFAGGGFFTSTSRPAQILGKTTTAGDGTFELGGLEPGVVFLDARADFTFVRQPAQVRIARGQTIDGIELLGSPGGRIRGTVKNAGGEPLGGVVVSARPGLNAFLGQLTQRRYRWLEASTDADGRYDIPGVPTGLGYTVSASGADMALEERFGIEVDEGQVRTVDIVGHPGARVTGRVLDPDGEPVVGANVAMVYLDVSRVLFSADGRAEPIQTAGDGSFVLDRVAAGRIGFLAAADGLAASPVCDMTVVDGGDYQGIELRLQQGVALSGIVVDDQEKPLPNCTIDVRPMEQPTDPDVLKLALRVRTVVANSGPDGRFTAAGIDASRVLVEATRAGYVTEVKFGVDPAEELRLVLTRGATVRGRVVDADGQPVKRFSIELRSQRIDPKTGEPVAQGRPRFGGGPPWARRGGAPRDASIRLQAGERLEDREIGDRWKEFASADGRFEIEGVPPGRIRVRARADGYRDSERKELDLGPGESGEELDLRLEAGAIARGTVVEAGTQKPVAEAQVTAYRQRDDGDSRGGFRFNLQMEDFDLLGLAEFGQRTARTDSAGHFEIEGLAGGRYHFTARHPDLAKASTKDVELAVEAPTEGIVIELEIGGGIEGQVTGAGKRPLADALVVAVSLQAGSLKSATTDKDGRYRIEGLPPGQYVVFKSRIDERAPNIGYDLMGNMRLKTVTVRRDRVTHLDIQDESEDGVRVWGTVRDGTEPVARAMVTAIGADSEGLFGMGLRAQPTDEQGRFELAGLKPGTYLFQVTRFAGRPQQASLSVDVPDAVREYRVDLDLPQSFVSGRVVDRSGNPVPRLRVAAGVEEGGMDAAPGLLGLILKNAVAETRTDENGEFKLDRMAVGTYRVTASGRRFGGRGGNAEFGDAAIEGVVVDGNAPVTGLEIVVPRAGRITGTVLDGSGNPAAGAEIVASREDGNAAPDAERQMMDLFGVQARPERSDAEGHFELSGVTPGTYTVRADAEGLSPGTAEGVVVVEEGSVDVTLRVVTGATLRLRARNIDGEDIPLASISVLDGKGRPLASNVSVTSVLRRLLGGQQRKSDTGWYEIGSVPPDTYTIVVREKDQPEIRVTRTIQDGEHVDWDIDVAAELEAAGRTKK